MSRTFHHFYQFSHKIGGCLFFLQNILDDLLNVGDLALGQPRGFDVPPVVESEKVVCADGEESCDFHQHIHRRQNIPVLPIADALLGNVQIFCQIHLAQTSVEP